MVYRELTSAQNIFYVDSDVFLNSAWNQGFLLTLNKKISDDKINNVLNDFLLKQDGTRLKIIEIQKKPYSFIDDFKPIVFEKLIFNDEASLNQFANDEVNKPFDYDQFLFRCYICEINDRSGIFFCSHHILCDGAGVASFLCILNALIKDEPIEVRSFIPHIEKELAYRNSEKYNKDKKFWLKEFEVKPQRLLFSQKTFNNDYAEDRCFFNITKEHAKKIRSYCYDKQVSPQAFFQTAFAIHFRRTVADNPFCIGMPLMNRNTVKDMETLGLYMHIVPLIINASENSFVANAKKIMDTEMSVYRHQNFSGYDITNSLNVGALYDVVINYNTLLRSNEYGMQYYFAKSLVAAIEIHIDDSIKDDIQIMIRYRKSFLSRTQVEEIGNSVLDIINSVLSGTDNQLLTFSKTPLLPNEYSELHGKTVPILGDNLYSLFSKNVELNKNKTCISFNDTKLTYSEFFDYTQKIANCLIDCGTAVNDKIAVVSLRSIEMYSAIYGVEGAGGCYIPIDPNYPDERIKWILKDSATKIVLAQDAYVEKLSNLFPTNEIKVLSIEQLLKSHLPNDVIVSLAKQTDLAYIIYTSGTTGNPKGAMNTHRAVINRLQWMQNAYPIEQNGVIMQKTPYTFDVSVWEIFWWGLYGGMLSVIPPDTHYNVSTIIDTIKKDEVTHVHFVPSVYRIFVNHLSDFGSDISKLGSLKHVFLSGEPLDNVTVNKFYGLCKNILQHNLYGPTECAVDVTFYDCPQIVPSIIPIGKPIDNTDIYIVDECKNLLPIGKHGELCIGGTAVGAGYLNMPDLTRAKFIDNPFSTGKLYMTGDVAFVDENGEIIFVGRKDTQIKFNGQRIELSEIESALRNYNEITDTVVIEYDNKLIAFYVGLETNVFKIKQYLKGRLPLFMVPTLILRVLEIPLGNHGKADRNALIGIYKKSLAEEEFESPKNNLESEICTIFAKQLNLDKFGRNQDFLESGASSLDVISVLCNDLFAHTSMDELCLNPRPADLAKFLLGKRKAPEALIPIYMAKTEKRAFILTPYAGGGVFSVYALMRSLRQILPDTSFYYYGWDSDTAKCVEEVKQLGKNTELYYYAHCAGISIALELISLVNKESLSIKRFFCGGYILPHKKRVIDWWKIVPNFVLKKLLIIGGMPNEIPDMKTNKKIMKVFRRDASRNFKTLKSLNDIINCDTVLFFSKKDIFTVNYKHADKYWKSYVTKIVKIEMIESETHYFLTEKCDELAEKIKRYLPGGTN